MAQYYRIANAISAAVELNYWSNRNNPGLQQRLTVLVRLHENMMKAGNIMSFVDTLAYHDYGSVICCSMRCEQQKADRIILDGARHPEWTHIAQEVKSSLDPTTFPDFQPGESSVIEYRIERKKASKQQILDRLRFESHKLPDETLHTYREWLYPLEYRNGKYL